MAPPSSIDRALFEHGAAPQLIVAYVARVEGATIAEANRAAADFYGVDPGGLRGRPFASLWADHAPLDDLLELGSTIGVHLADTTHRHASGEERAAAVYLSPLPDGRIHVLVLDMAERARAEARTRERDAERLARQLTQRAADEWQATFDAMAQPIALVDDNGRVVRANAAAAWLMGAPAADLVGAPLGGTGDPGFWGALRDLARTRGADTQLRDQSGRTWAATAVPTIDGTAAVLVLQELTTLLALQDAVQRRESMVRMGELVAGVAHEVRNPLFAISSLLDAARQRLGGHPDFARIAPMLDAQVQRLSALMRDLLDYGKPADLVRVPTAVRDLEAAVDAALREEARAAGVSMVWRTADDHLVHVDRVRFVQLLVNLVANAIQHSRRGGSVEIEVRAAPEATTFQVSDGGPGFPPDLLPHALEPFVTRRPGGTGLGLALAHRIAVQHGATILVRNRVTEDGGVAGAEVTLRLPVTTALPPLPT